MAMQAANDKVIRFKLPMSFVVTKVIRLRLLVKGLVLLL